jgi:hypothetical protein
VFDSTQIEQDKQEHLADINANSVVRSHFNDIQQQDTPDIRAKASDNHISNTDTVSDLIQSAALPFSLTSEFTSFNSDTINRSHLGREDDFDIDEYNARFEAIDNVYNGNAKASGDINQAHQEIKINKKLMGSDDSFVTSYVKTKKKHKTLDHCDLRCAVLFTTLMNNSQLYSHAIAVIDSKISAAQLVIKEIDKELDEIDGKLTKLDNAILESETQIENINRELHKEHAAVDTQQQEVDRMEYFEKKFAEQSASGGDISIGEDGNIVFSFVDENGNSVWVQGHKEIVDGNVVLSGLRELTESEKAHFIQEISPHDDPSAVDHVSQMETGSIGQCLAPNHPDNVMLQDALENTRELAQERLDVMQKRLTQTIHRSQELISRHREMQAEREALLERQAELESKKELKEQEIADLEAAKARLEEIDLKDENCDAIIKKELKNIEKLESIRGNLSIASKNNADLLSDDEYTRAVNNEILEILDDSAVYSEDAYEYRSELSSLDEKFNVVSFQYDEGLTNEMMLAKYDGGDISGQMRPAVYHPTHLNDAPKISVA